MTKPLKMQLKPFAITPTDNYQLNLMLPRNKQITDLKSLPARELYRNILNPEH
jgi:hypothetical protein